MTKKEYDLEIANLPREISDIREPPDKPISRFRVILPQVLASTAKNLLLLDLGLTIAFPTIAIAALRNSSTEAFFLNDEQASWLGSINFICQPLGSLVSGIMMEPLGRKWSMIVVNFPHIVGWFLMYSATSVTTLYVASVIMGLGIGFMEAPIITYVGEISQPELRGILTSYAGLFVQIGFFVEYLFGTIMDWRMAAAISAGVPIVTVLAITQVPETPMWLLSKGRVKEAEKSLCWLRGWVKPSVIQEEFQEMIRYSKEINKKKQKNIQLDGVTKPEIQEEGSTINEDSFVKKLKLLGKRHTLWPMVLVCCFFFFQHASGLPGTRPYLVQVFEEFGLPMDAHWATVIFALIGIIGNVLCMVVVRWTGKRPLSLVSLGSCAIICILLGLYAFFSITPGPSNPDQLNTWMPLTLFIALSFAFSFGVGPIPWMLVSEVFPFKSRGFASGIAAAISYILGFVVSKTFLSLKNHFHLHGVFWVYGVSSCAGFVFLYLYLKETEGKTLVDIEEHYKKKVKVTDTSMMTSSVVTLVNAEVVGGDMPKDLRIVEARNAKT